MALIKCPECNKDISDKARACVHCGCPLRIEQAASTKKKSKNIIFLAVISAFVLLFAVLLSNLNKPNINNEIELIEKIFSMSRDEILSTYPNVREDSGDDLYFEGTFAELEGIFDICIAKDGTVWRVIFERYNEDEEIDVEETIDIISNSLGDYSEYDSEWNDYVWETKKLQVDFWPEERTYIDWIGD